MASINIQEIVVEITGSAQGILESKWHSFKPYAEHEFRQFTENAEFLANLRINNEINDAELKARLELQKLALKNVLLAIEGIGLIAAQEVINAAINILAKAIKTVLNISLPI